MGFGEQIGDNAPRRPDAEAMNARSRVGEKVIIVPSRGVDCWQSIDLLTNERMRDDVEGSASALGAGSVKCGPLLLIEQLGKVGSASEQMGSA